MHLFAAHYQSSKCVSFFSLSFFTSQFLQTGSQKHIRGGSDENSVAVVGVPCCCCCCQQSVAIVCRAKSTNFVLSLFLGWWFIPCVFLPAHWRMCQIESQSIARRTQLCSCSSSSASTLLKVLIIVLPSFPIFHICPWFDVLPVWALPAVERQWRGSCSTCITTPYNHLNQHQTVKRRETLPFAKRKKAKQWTK